MKFKQRLFCLLLVLLTLLVSACADAAGTVLETAAEVVDSALAETGLTEPGTVTGLTGAAKATATPRSTKKAKATATPKSTKKAKATATPAPTEEAAVREDGVYTTKEDVALYIHLYGHLPANFITKDEAEDLGWSGGSLEPYAPGCSIGGDRFGNREGLLPRQKGRTYTECDIDTMGARSRGAKRIVFSNDGLIYYTGDHYASFTLLYGEE